LTDDGIQMSLFVVERQINVTLPFSSVKMLSVQPCLEFAGPLQEPFPLAAGCCARLCQSVDKAFDIARTFDPHFFLFPEFGLPGVEAVRKIATHMATAEVPSSRIAIAGVQGLSKTQYVELCGLPNIHVEAANAPHNVGDKQWVNTSVTFVKDSRGALTLWIQPKISPSWPEANERHQQMFLGKAVNIFEAKFDNDVPCRFFSLLCFDWVGQEDGAAVPATILQKFDGLCRTAQTQRSLQWVFILQHNPSPNHATFLNAANNFLSQPDPAFVQRHDTAVVMVSTANAKHPARREPFGYSGVIFGPRAPFDVNGCAPTFATQSSRLRASTALLTCKDALFREMGECIHTAVVRVPASVVANPTDRTSAVVEAKIYPIVGNGTDPRMPGGPVPAVVKWVNDELDVLTDVDFVGTGMEGDLKESHARTVEAYRRLQSQDLAKRVDGACALRVQKRQKSGGSGPSPDPAADVDIAWDADERGALQHVIQSLTLIDGVAALDAGGAQLHARYPVTGVEIGAIRGPKHTDCVPAFKLWAERTHSPVLFVSRDENNVPVLGREVENFTDPGGSQGIKITDAQTLLAKARSATDAEYRHFIWELLDVPDRSII
jgi:hypothetical protein